MATTTQNKVVQVLIVDDNKDAADFLGLVIKVYGHEVDVVYCGSDVEDAIERIDPDLVFLDIAMPEMNGFQVAERLKDHLRRRKFILVAYTAYDRKLDHKISNLTGFDFHICKPIETDELNALIRMAQRGGL